jgi:hypothetical protein
VHPYARGLGIGRLLVDAVDVDRIRVKTDMSSGDPAGFYTRLGYRDRGADPARPHVHDYTRAAPLIFRGAP